jgi:hypothetical protein
MTRNHYIAIRVAYDRHPSYGRSLEWIAPELRDAGLTLTEDHSAATPPRRTWAGFVDDAVFRRFADAWRLHTKHREGTLDVVTEAGRLSVNAYTFDGMNWERWGRSPIVYVAVLVGAVGHRRGRVGAGSSDGHARRGADRQRRAVLGWSS